MVGGKYEIEMNNEKSCNFFFPRAREHNNNNNINNNKKKELNFKFQKRKIKIIMKKPKETVIELIIEIIIDYLIVFCPGLWRKWRRRGRRRRKGRRRRWWMWAGCERRHRHFCRQVAGRATGAVSGNADRSDSRGWCSAGSTSRRT